MSWFRMTNLATGQVTRESRTEDLSGDELKYVENLQAYCQKNPSEQADKLREAAMRRIERERQELDLKRGLK